VDIKPNGKYRIKCNSKYFESKYHEPNPVFVAEAKTTLGYNSPSFLYMGRAIADGTFTKSDLWYGHVSGMGEIVSAGELEEIKP
jgi:hypothetical protein